MATWLSTVEVAKELNVSTYRVWQWCRRGLTRNGVTLRLRSQRIGGRFSIRRDWLEAFLKACNGGEAVELGNPASEDRDALRDQEEARRELARR